MIKKGKKVSQDDIAKLCNVSRQTINAIEINKYNPSLSLAFDLAKHLEMTVDELFVKVHTFIAYRQKLVAKDREL